MGTILAIDDGTHYLDLYTGTTTLNFERDWTNAPFWRAGTFTNDTWQHVAVTYDGGSTANVPVMYFNGVSQSVTTATAPSGSLASISHVPSIGNDSTSGFAWDGMIAELGLWNGTLLTANEVATLAKGVSPLLVRPSALTLYCPLYGGQTNEQDFGSGHQTMTVTGAKAQNHAPATSMPLV